MLVAFRREFMPLGLELTALLDELFDLIKNVTFRPWRWNISMIRQMPMRSPYSLSVTAAMFRLKTALAGGIVWVPCRWSDSRVAKFSGHTSQGIMKVTQIFALSGHSMIRGRAMGESPPVRRRF